MISETQHILIEPYESEPLDTSNPDTNVFLSPPISLTNPPFDYDFFIGTLKLFYPRMTATDEYWVKDALVNYKPYAHDYISILLNEYSRTILNNTDIHAADSQRTNILSSLITTTSSESSDIFTSVIANGFKALSQGINTSCSFIKKFMSEYTDKNKFSDDKLNKRLKQSLLSKTPLFNDYFRQSADDTFTFAPHLLNNESIELFIVSLLMASFYEPTELNFTSASTNELIRDLYQKCFKNPTYENKLVLTLTINLVALSATPVSIFTMLSTLDICDQYTTLSNMVYMAMYNDTVLNILTSKDTDNRIKNVIKSFFVCASLNTTFESFGKTASIERDINKLNMTPPDVLKLAFKPNEDTKQKRIPGDIRYVVAFYDFEGEHVYEVHKIVNAERFETLSDDKLFETLREKFIVAKKDNINDAYRVIHGGVMSKREREQEAAEKHSLKGLLHDELTKTRNNVMMKWLLVGVIVVLLIGIICVQTEINSEASKFKNEMIKKLGLGESVQ